MAEALPSYPECWSVHAYVAASLLNYSECGHEWVADAAPSAVIKVGTKARGIQLAKDHHDIDCWIPGIGQIGLKSQFVRKVID